MRAIVARTHRAVGRGPCGSGLRVACRLVTRDAALLVRHPLEREAAAAELLQRRQRRRRTARPWRPGLTACTRPAGTRLSTRRSLVQVRTGSLRPQRRYERRRFGAPSVRAGWRPSWLARLAARASHRVRQLMRLRSRRLCAPPSHSGPYRFRHGRWSGSTVHPWAPTTGTSCAALSLARQFPGRRRGRARTAAGETVRRIGPIQSQTARSPYAALGARLPGVTHEAITDGVRVAGDRPRAAPSGAPSTPPRPTTTLLLDATTRVGQRAIWVRHLPLRHGEVEDVWLATEQFAADSWRTPGRAARPSCAAGCSTTARMSRRRSTAAWAVTSRSATATCSAGR